VVTIGIASGEVNAGTPQTLTTTFREWVCPDCDYFEEVEDWKRDVTGS
jgi:acetone carboxylase gamma subunit